MTAASPTQMIAIKTLVAFLLATFLTTGRALAIDQPPQYPQQQRAWLIGHLVTDMDALGVFDGNALARVPSIINSLTDDQVALTTAPAVHVNVPRPVAYASYARPAAQFQAGPRWGGYPRRR
jgi:hypothetical protein